MTDKPEKNQSDLELDAFFAAAREDAPLPGADLVTRILTDADMAMAKPVPRRGWREVLAAGLEAMGGWPAAAGLTAAAVAGVTIGMAVPEVLDTLAGLDTTDDFLPSYAALLEEG